MRIKFWKRPHYFDFSLHRRPAVILYDLPGAILAVIYGIAAYSGVYGTAATVYGVTIGGTIYGVSIAGTLAYALVAGAMYGATALTSSHAAKSGQQSSLSTGGFLVYDRGKSL